tara:strand:+ start:7225 stop:8145 length:921 start_codon:yes stop_codon:yes gene_type:complete
MPRRPTIADTFLDATKERRLKQNPGEIEAHSSGFGNGPMLAAKPQLTVTPAEKVIDGESNAAIIIGRDRPGTRAQGLGAVGRWTNVARIDLIAGINGVCAKETDAEGNPIATDPSTYMDSSRIYMTQQASNIDSDEYFGIVEGKVGYVKNEPAIVIKSDSVRIVGRQGVKIVTGTDKYAAGSGWFIGQQVRGIDLIAGNDDRGLQPLVKGDDLYTLLVRQQELTSELLGFLDFQLKLLLTYMASQSKVPVVSAPAQTKLAGMMISLVPHVIRMNVWTLKSVFHKLNFSDRNPFAFYNFKSKFNTTN